MIKPTNAAQKNKIHVQTSLWLINDDEGDTDDASDGDGEWLGRETY